mmetsp:Transcript_25121/g.50748  ORF Transcript_25121/g.50748 Transcript_25121/m.50748 type:complete len:213 (-) Transcript_25121:584-1222(-)
MIQRRHPRRIYPNSLPRKPQIPPKPRTPKPLPPKSMIHRAHPPVMPRRKPTRPPPGDPSIRPYSLLTTIFDRKMIPTTRESTNTTTEWPSNALAILRRPLPMRRKCVKRNCKHKRRRQSWQRERRRQEGHKRRRRRFADQPTRVKRLLWMVRRRQKEVRCKKWSRPRKRTRKRMPRGLHRRSRHQFLPNSTNLLPMMIPPCFVVQNELVCRQ